MWISELVDNVFLLSFLLLIPRLRCVVFRSDSYQDYNEPWTMSFWCLCFYSHQEYDVVFRDQAVSFHSSFSVVPHVKIAVCAAASRHEPANVFLSLCC